jgi:16S rRNA pseudouridine516 synthase
MIRLDKFLANETGMTRKEVKDLLKKGLVTVNDEVVKKPETKVEPDSDKIICDGKEVSYCPLVYYMFHKPAGCVSATQDNHDKTVLDFFTASERKKDLFPVGRLDKDTEGLLLITNDGELAHRLLSPKKHVDKTYYVEIDKPITNNDATQLTEGIDIGEKNKTLPATLEKLSDYSYYITIQEGKFHQIKRMFQAVGSEVTYLKRLRMGTLNLDTNLAPGTYRPLSEEEVYGLYGKDSKTDE